MIDLLIIFKLFLEVLKNKSYSPNRCNYNGDKPFYEKIKISTNIGYVFSVIFFPSNSF